MLTIGGPGSSVRSGMDRRGFLQIGSLGCGGLTLPQILRAEDQAGIKSPHKGIINILLPGGPTHLDTIDLKPHAPPEIRGEFLPIATSVPGFEICELMPRTARIMDRMIAIRSLVGALNDHNMHQCLTGWESHPAQTKSPEIPGFPPGGWPSIGAVASKVFGPAVPGTPPSVDLIPVYFDAKFVLSARPGQPGYLGPAHAGFEVNAVDRQNITLQGISIDRLADRKRLLSRFDQFRRQADGDGIMEQMDSANRQAINLMTSPRLADALDLEKEDPRVRERYGVDLAANPRRQGPKHLDQFLLARRVIEAGARCVTMTFSRYPFGRMSQGDYNWDWHKNVFAECRATLPMLDLGIAALVEDLDERGMLEDVTVVIWGEFGRTPRINGNAGRDHWPNVAPALLAGGGMRAGQVIGATNRYGEDPKERPVHFREVFATLYHNLGIDVATRQFKDLAGRPQYLVDGRKPLAELI
ncbi:MAG: DUF1501 domain-containing protein [Pirellulaceae bacterium]|nr:DUF1501 domain-containing protein [Pirellulaceae bacterium]